MGAIGFPECCLGIVVFWGHIIDIIAVPDPWNYGIMVIT